MIMKVINTLPPKKNGKKRKKIIRKNIENE